MPQERKAVVVLIQRDGVLGIMDARGCIHVAEDAEDLGRRCLAVLNDPDLPPIAMPTSTDIAIERLATEAAQALSRGTKSLVSLVAPALKGTGKAVTQMRQRSEANRRQEERQAQDRVRQSGQRRRLVHGRRRVTQ